MPTNILRNTARPRPSSASVGPAATRDILITAGACRIRARLCPTQTAERLWAALPLFSTVETWGDSIHLELPIESGRERGAKLNGQIGEIYYWAEDDRMLIVFGPTPISRPNEIRLPRPCNVLATTNDDLACLRALTPGEKVGIRRAE